MHRMTTPLFARTKCPALRSFGEIGAEAYWVVHPQTLLVESVTGGGPGGADPPATWLSGREPAPPDMRPSSVARIMPGPHNFNGTMNHGTRPSR